MHLTMLNQSEICPTVSQSESQFYSFRKQDMAGIGDAYFFNVEIIPIPHITDLVLVSLRKHKTA